MPMDFWGWAQVRSFHCYMYWPLLDMHWENSGFGLGEFNNGGGSNKRGRGLYYIPEVPCFGSLLQCLD